MKMNDPLTELERKTVLENLERYELLKKSCPDKCMKCEFPLPLDHEFSVTHIGKVCKLCFDMFWAAYKPENTGGTYEYA